MAPAQRRGPWVPEEDQLLMQLVREQGPNNWVRISQHMHFRSPKQCRERFHQNLKPSLNREPISAEEGLMIERMVNDMGKRWAEIARRLGNRSDNAVKNWWNGSMNRKRRCLHSHAGHTARTHNGRVEPPYVPSALAGQRPLWTRSPKTPLEGTGSVDIKPSSTEIVAGPTIPSSSSLSITMQTASPRQLTSIFTLPAINRPVDAPLSSPAFSDASHAPSMGPPSLISDHNSISSASPRTLPSPQLLPLPMDVRPNYGEMRRQSAPSLHASTEDAYLASDVPHGFLKGRAPETSGDFVTRRWGPSDHSAHSWNQRSPPSLPPVWNRLSHDQRPQSSGSTLRPPIPSRDARMGLDNLLN